MAKNTSILLGDYFDNFVSRQVESGRFTSVSEVVRTALRHFEQEETKRQVLINALNEGEDSGFIELDREKFFEKMHLKHTPDAV